MSKHILLCDDEAPILRATEIKLSRAGYRVTCCGNGQEALEAVGRDKPDLLITDCQMPRMGGLELIERLRADPTTAELPVMMLTGKGFELPVEDLRGRLGVIAIISKPFSPREVAKLIEGVFATAGA